MKSRNELWSQMLKPFQQYGNPCAAVSTDPVPQIATPAPFQTKAVDLFSKLGGKVIPLDGNNSEFSAVNEIFRKGFTRWHGKPRLTAVHKVVNSEAKEKYFGEQMLEVERCRGNANLKYAWHGTSADAVASIVLYGFGQRPMPINGNSYGSGIYLAPANRLEVSASYAAMDDNHEQHVLLCEVILGESEIIPTGSRHRFLPSSTDYDTGTDDLVNPSLYVIWSPFINSHIIPWYIVSFITEECIPTFSGPLRRTRQQKSDFKRPTPYVLRQPLNLVVPQTLFHPSGLRTGAKSPVQSPRAGATDQVGSDGSKNSLVSCSDSAADKVKEATKVFQATSKKIQEVLELLSRNAGAGTSTMGLGLGLGLGLGRNNSGALGLGLGRNNSGALGLGLGRNNSGPVMFSWTDNEDNDSKSYSQNAGHDEQQ